MKPITLCALIGASGLLLTACNDRNPAFNQLPGFIRATFFSTITMALPTIF